MYNIYVYIYYTYQSAQQKECYKLNLEGIQYDMLYWMSPWYDVFESAVLQ